MSSAGSPSCRPGSVQLNLKKNMKRPGKLILTARRGRSKQKNKTKNLFKQICPIYIFYRNIKTPALIAGAPSPFPFNSLPPPSLFAPATQVMTVPGGGSGRIHSGGPGAPSLILEQTEARRAEIKFFVTARPPPPPSPYLKVWIRY